MIGRRGFIAGLIACIATAAVAQVGFSKGKDTSLKSREWTSLASEPKGDFGFRDGLAMYMPRGKWRMNGTIAFSAKAEAAIALKATMITIGFPPSSPPLQDRPVIGFAIHYTKQAGPDGFVFDLGEVNCEIGV